MADDVKIPPLPKAIFTEWAGRDVLWFSADQMRAFYLQGYNDGRNAPRVLGAGLDPWPNSGDPAISDALHAPDLPLTQDQAYDLYFKVAAEVSKLESRGWKQTFAGWFHIAVREIEAAHGIWKKS